MASSGIHNIKLYMKKLYRYLVANGYGNENYDGLFSFAISRESKLYPAASPNEVNRTLDVIDRRTPQGKRDYAMVLLGAVTGLRAVDIAKMKLTDIDWKKGEIKIVQSKTGKPVALPLTKDVGEAVSEYILKARPKVECDNVFLRVRVPYRPFAAGSAIGYIYDYYRKRTGLPRDAYDGKGFHSLRRSVGKNLVTSGAPITMVAQILGDSDIDSTKKYISLDSDNLKECALGFDGIKPKRGVLSL
jgi:integrase